MQRETWMPDCPETGQIGMKWDKSGTFNDQFSVLIITSTKFVSRQNAQKTDITSPEFIPFLANLDKLLIKCDIPGYNNTAIVSVLPHSVNAISSQGC